MSGLPDGSDPQSYKHGDFTPESRETEKIWDNAAGRAFFYWVAEKWNPWDE